EVAERKIGRDVERESRSPGENREKSPSLGEALWARLPHAVERKLPRAAESDAVADVRVARCAIKLGIVRRHLVAALPEAGGVIDTVPVGVGKREIDVPCGRVADLFGQAHVQ